MENPLFSACQFQQKCASWQQAVTLACQPLEQQGVITADYANTIVKTTEQQGPWYILSPAFALPHARPEDGAICQQSHLSLLCLGEAVVFPGYPEVRLVIVLAAANGLQHIEMIQKLVCWLDDEERLSQLTNISGAGQLHALLSVMPPLRHAPQASDAGPLCATASADR